MSVNGGWRGENGGMGREGRAKEKSFSVCEVFVECPYLPLHFPPNFTFCSIALYLTFSRSVRGPVRPFVSGIVCEGLSGVFGERRKGVFVFGCKKERVIGRTRRQQAALR